LQEIIAIKEMLQEEDWKKSNHYKFSRKAGIYYGQILGIVI
jgi:hypothetical protein